MPPWKNDPTWEQQIRKDGFKSDDNVPPQPPRGSNRQSTARRPPHRDTAQRESCPLASHGTPMRKGHARPAADNHRDPGFDSDIIIQLFALLSLYATGRNTLEPSQIPESLPGLDPRDPNLRRVFDSTLCNPDFPARILRALTCILDATVRRHAESAADKAYGLLLSRPHQDWLSVFDEVKDAIGRPSCATQSPDARGGPAPQVPPSS